MASWFWRVYIVLGLAFVSLPVVVMGLYSFSEPRIPVWPIESFSTEWYARLFSDEPMLDALKNSVRVSIAVGLGATVMGALAAYYFARFNPPWANFYTIFVVAPAVTPTTVLSLGLLVYFIDLGIWGNLEAVVIAHIGLVAVFSLFIIRNRMSEIDPQIEMAAMNLGAGRLKAIWTTTLPLALPALVASFVIAAGLSFGESLIASYVTATTYTWPAYVLNNIRVNISPEIYASAFLSYIGFVVLLLVGLAVSSLFTQLARIRSVGAALLGRRQAPRGEVAESQGDLA
jgi:spermidine/putrescine transport system permease protein